MNIGISKLLEHVSGKLVDGLAIIDIGPNVEELLGFPELYASTGIEISSAVYDKLFVINRLSPRICIVQLRQILED